jgi:hypothetical protein
VSRQAGRIDIVHKECVIAFLYHGCSVKTLASVGEGVPDLLVGDHGVTHLVEVKSHPAGTQKGEPNAAQKQWLLGWTGDYTITRGADDVKRLVEKWRSDALIRRA